MHDEFAAETAAVAMCFYCAPMQFDQPLRKRESDAESTLVETIIARLAPEHVEDAR